MQATLIALGLLTGFGGYFVVLLYEVIPALLIFSTGIQVPRMGGIIPDFFLMLIPAASYSLIIGMVAVIIGNLVRRRNPSQDFD